MCERFNKTQLVIAWLYVVVACGSDSAGAGVATTQNPSATQAIGSAGTGGAASAGSSAGARAANPDDIGNHFASGAWQGYFWTNAQGAGSSITPTDFSAQKTGMPRCVSGTVAKTSDYSGVAILGVNLHETNIGKMAVTPTKKGVIVEVQNKSEVTLLFEVEAPSDAASKRWCTLLKGSGGFIPWSSLNSNCWDNSGTPYKNEPIVSAAIVVPGSMTAAVPFDFCLATLMEADGP